MKSVIFTSLFLFLSSCILVSQAFSQEDARHYTCFRTSNPIVADGILDEPDWKLADWSEEFVDITGNTKLKPSQTTCVKMLWDEQNIYIATELREKDVWATLRQRDTVIYHDNDFEVFLDIEGNAVNYYEVEVNALGTLWDLLLTKPYRDHGRPVTAWNLEGLKAGIHVNGSLNDPASADTSWVVEMVLPIAALMQGKNVAFTPADGIQWRLNFSRVQWKTLVEKGSYRKPINPKTGKPFPEQNWVWAPMGEISMHIPERWGWLEFSSSNITPRPFSYLNDDQRKNFKVWLWMGGNASWSAEKWDSVFRSFKMAGVDGVLTQADPATLKKMIPAGQKQGIRVEKWFIAMMNNDKKLINEHPDWFVVNREGKSSITDPAYVGYYRFLCPSNPAVLSYLKKRVNEYLDIPGLNGIHLDYIRYPDVILPRALWRTYGIVQDTEHPPYDYCYCGVCRETFRSRYGKDPMKMAHPDTNTSWRQFRYDQITTIVQELAIECHRKEKKISAAVFPGPSLSKQLVRQEWDKWPLNEVMPMLYQNFYYGSLDWIRKETAEGTVALSGKAPLYSGLYIPSLSPRELRAAIQKCIDGGASGVCLFNYESMKPQHWAVLKTLFGD